MNPFASLMNPLVFRPGDPSTGATPYRSFRQKPEPIKYDNPWNLTPREEEVMDMLVTGATQKETAENMNVALNTIETHVYRIKQKMGNVNMLRAAVLWDRHSREVA